MNAPQQKSSKRRWWLLIPVLFVLAVALAPSLAGGAIVDRVLASASETRRGTLAVEQSSVSWFSATSLDGLSIRDDAGDLVAQVSVEAPSLFALAKGLGADLGHVTVRGHADLVAADDGSTNLQRALEELEPEPEAAAGDEASSPDELPTVTLDVELERVTWSDPGSRERGVELGLRDLTAHVVVDTSAETTAEVRGRMLGAEDSELTVDATVERPLAELDSDEPPSFSVSVDVEGIATGLVDTLLATDGLLREACGDSLSLVLDAEGTTKKGSLDFALRADELDVTTALDLADGVLSEADASAPLTIELRSAQALIERFADALPEGASVRTLGEAPTKFELTRLALPLEVLTADDPVTRVLEVLDAGLRVGLPELEYAHPSPEAGREPTRLRLTQATLETMLAKGAPATGTFRANVGTSEVGTFTADFAHPDPTRALGDDAPPITFQGRLSDMPTSVADELANQNGLLIDVLGPRIQGSLEGSWPLEAAPLIAKLSSNSGEVDLVANTTDGVLSSGAEGKLAAHVGLSPLLSERIVGSLLPLMVGVAPTDPAQRIRLEVSDFALPLDGDLSKLSARVGLDLGSVDYSILPGLDPILSLAGGVSATRSQRLQPLELVVEAGKVAYDAIPLSIDGNDYPLAGSLSLGERSLDLTTDLPLSLLGKDATGFLGKATRALSSESLVPLRLHGTWTRPSVAIRDGFVENLLEQAGSDLLERGLRDLFGRD